MFGPSYMSHPTFVFLDGVSLGTFVRIQYDGGGAAGVWEGTYQGIDNRGNALFYNLFNPTTNTTLTGITRMLKYPFRLLISEKLKLHFLVMLLNHQVMFWMGTQG